MDLGKRGSVKGNLGLWGFRVAACDEFGNEDRESASEVQGGAV